MVFTQLYPPVTVRSEIYFIGYNIDLGAILIIVKFLMVNFLSDLKKLPTLSANIAKQNIVK